MVKRIAMLLVVAILFGIIVWNIDFKHRETAQQICSPVKTSTTQKAAEVGSSIGDILYQLKNDATAWTATQIDEYLTGASAVWKIIGFGFKQAAKEGKIKADKAVTGMVPTPIDCSKVCMNPPAPEPPAPGGGDGPPIDAMGVTYQKSSEFTAEQQAIAASAYKVAAEMGIPRRGMVVILAAGFQESGVRNLSYGDSSSVGWLQLISSNGSYAQRMNPAYSARWFFGYLKKVPGWESLPVTVAAQRVQRSAYPGAYAKWEDDAERLLASLGPQTPLGNDPVNPAVPDKPTTPSGPCATGSGVRVGSWNIYHSNADVNVSAGMAALGAQTDVIGGQEFNESAYVTAALVGLPGWKVLGDDTRQPIFYNPGVLTPVASGKIRAWTGATPAGIPERWITWVTFRTPNGSQFSTTNTHMLAQIEKHGQLDTAHEPVRTRLAVIQLRTLAAQVKKLAKAGPVMSTGDFNAVPTNNALAGAMGGAGLSPNWATLGVVPTHGTRTIDYVWSTITPAAQTVLAKFGSDHSPVVVTYPADQASLNVAAGPTPAAWSHLGNPRTPEQAIAFLQARMPGGIPGYRVQGHCEGYMTRAYGNAGGYPTAIAHWNAAGEKHPGMDEPPRGALVYWRTGNAAGHVALSLGGGRVISTDFNGTSYQAGVVGEGPITALDKWGARLGYRPPSFRVQA